MTLAKSGCSCGATWNRRNHLLFAECASFDAAGNPGRGCQRTLVYRVPIGRSQRRDWAGGLRSTPLAGMVSTHHLVDGRSHLADVGAPRRAKKTVLAGMTDGKSCRTAQIVEYPRGTASVECDLSVEMVGVAAQETAASHSVSLPGNASGRDHRPLAILMRV